MRIGIIAHLKYPISEPFAGGLEMHTHLLASKLIERGHDVETFCADGSDVDGAIHVCAPTAPLDDTENAYAICDAREHRAYLRVMDHLRHARYDVVQNNSLHYLPLDMSSIIESPIVTTLHTPPFVPFTAAAERAAHRHHLFMPVSDTIATEWAIHGVSGASIANGVDLRRFTFHAQAVDPAYAVWFGRVVPEKGLHFAIQAARRAGLPLRFAGPIHSPHYFETQIAPLMGPDISYEGHLDHAGLARLIGGARVFLCTPCWDEPFGLVVAEALASGVPVAAFARGAIPSIIDASSGALARPDDVASLAMAATVASSLVRADCRRRAERVCDVELMIDRYLDLYRTISGIPAVDGPLRDDRISSEICVN